MFFLSLELVSVYVVISDFSFLRQDVANHLLKCLGDEDEAIQNQSFNLIPLIG